MTKRRTFLAVLLGLIVALCLSFAVACGGDEAETATLKWTIEGEKEHVTVTVDESTTLPESFTVGETLTFKVTPDTGYDVAVKVGRSPLSEKNGVYTYSVKKGTTEITVTVSKRVKSVAVTKNPTKLTYFAGETLDPAGMEVTVTYEAGDPDKLTTGYVINYPTSDKGCFLLGDKSFTVSYGNFTSDPVQLTAAVEAKIVINPVGGAIDEDILASWKERTDLNDYQVAADGTISFTYLKLTASMALPTDEQIKLEGGTFLGWTTVVGEGEEATAYTQIGTDNKMSLELRANWHMILVEAKSIKLEVSNGTPYLVMELTTNTALSAYLYLYEGNAKVGFQGDPISGTPGSTVTLRYDLTKLSSAKLPTDEDIQTNHTGKSELYTSFWMDIRVNTNINGVELSQSIEYDYSDPIAQIGSGIQVGNWSYGLRMDRRNGADYIRVYFKSFKYTYEVKVEDVQSKPTLKFNGTLNTALDEDFATKYADADITIAIGSITASGKVQADGTWTATADLSELTEGFNDMAGKITVTAADGSSLDLKVENDNGEIKKESLDLNGCRTIFAYDPDGSEPRYFANKFISANGLRYDVGNDWNELYLRVVDPSSIFVIRGDVDLKVDNNKVYYIVTVSAGSNYTEASLKSTIWFGDGSDYINPEKVNSLGSELYELWFNVTERAANSQKLYVHLKIGATIDDASGWDGGNGDIKDADNSANGKFVILGNKKYRVSSGDANDYNMPNLVVEPYDGNEDYTLTSAELVVEGQKVYLKVGGTMPNADDKTKVEEFLNGIYADMQQRGDSWTRNKLTVSDVTVSADGKTWSLKLDVTDLAVHENAYTGHFGSTDGVGGEDGNTKDLKVPAEGAQDGMSVTLGNKKYTLVNKYGSGAAEDNWGCVSVKVEDVAE